MPRKTPGRQTPGTLAEDCVIALDVGGTGMKGALLDRELCLRATLRRATPRASGPDAVVGAIASALRELAAQAHADGLTVRQVGVVVPGIVREDDGIAVYSANLGWRDLALTELLAARTGLPVVLGHDVRAGAVAECMLGAARGAGDALFLAIGTGVAGALVSDGRLVHGGGYAGEIGHVRVEPDGARCGCGGRGCLESLASATAVAAAYAARTGRAVEGAAQVAARVAAGDPDAVAVWDRAARGLATALATAVTLLAPEVIVLGGGLAEAGDLLLDPVRAYLAEQLTFQRAPLLVRADLGDEAGCMGAGLYAWHRVPDRVPAGFASAESASPGFASPVPASAPVSPAAASDRLPAGWSR
ncbi:ROK family protein [Streptacidiphilus cavernicola]|uniref:ROK family protein n=1 Tax=Streptacidiphilus cavernicola TaxID=3342716 RepID=A0ABV6VN94_9ACTN